MSISKLFVKVFNEDIFEHLDQDNSDLEDDLEGANCSTVPDSRAPKISELSVTKQMAIVRNWLDDKFQQIQTDSNEEIRKLYIETEARIGPDLAIFDVDYTTTVRVSTDRLTLRSQGSFNTVRANCCVYGGRWMYEIQLHTKGVMQIGWSSGNCSFNENSGVGDTSYSYGYDGSKQQVWHISTRKYGDKWQIGDIIGVTIDVDREIIEFYRNGRSMGIAFEKIQKGPGITFFPSISLGYTQGVQANFGNRPFVYPLVGYQPLMARPILKLRRANLLMDYLINLAGIFSHYNAQTRSSTQMAGEVRVSTKKTVYCIFATLLIERFTNGVFDPYIIEDVLLARIASMTTLSAEKENPHSVLNGLLSLFWNFMEDDEIKFVLRKMVNALLATYTHTVQGMDYSKHRHVLNVLHCLCLHEQTRKYLLDSKLFKKHCLAFFLYISPLEFYIMEELLPDHMAWTEGIDGPKDKYANVVEKVRKSTESLYAAEKDFLNTLMINSDGNAETPSTRKLFLNKMRRYVMDLSMEQRPFHAFFFMQSSIQHPLDSSVALAFVSILIDQVRSLFKDELPSHIMEVGIDYFLDGTFDYMHFDRVGGVLSHLRKVHRGDIDAYLGAERTQAIYDEDHNSVRVSEVDTTLYLLGENINNVAVVGHTQGANNSTFTHFLNPRMPQNPDTAPGNSSMESSVCELLDICVLFYYSAGHKYIVKIASVRDEIAMLNEVLKETKYYREDIERKLLTLEQHANVCMNDNHQHIMSELRTKFSQRQNVFATRSISLARKQVWLRAVALNTHRRSLLIWLMERILRSLTSASGSGPLFAFVPEIYINTTPILLDTVMDFSHHDMRAQFDIGDAECGINAAAEFLAMHSADSRIVLASCKDSLLQALGTLTCHKSGVRALERSSKRAQTALVRALLRPYENRAWGQSNWLLLRFWLGEGFAFKDARQPSVWQGGSQPLHHGLCRSRSRNETHTGLLHNVAPANPSKHFQRLIGTKLYEDEPLATTFLNSVLSQLNWAFSEFILLLQEIQNTAQRQENTLFEPKQLKICSMCFELTVSLMRCLEMIITVAPDVVGDESRGNSDLILNRICQLISQVLSRVTVPPGCFQFVVDMCSADLNAVTHFPIISAALGILMALLRNEVEHDITPQKVTRISRAFLTDPSFQFATLEFALGEVRTPLLEQKEIPRGNFDPSSRPHIDPLTNDVRVPHLNNSKRIRADPPIIKFALIDYPTHVSLEEIEDVRHLIENLRIKQALLSDITLPSEDSLCPICCAKPITAVFTPCKHQSCSDCIMQHMMNSKLCFYCKTTIQTIETLDGTLIYSNEEAIQPTLTDCV
ncbi:E3 ubiquitin-protein ligase RNF123 isoform X2 [Drosophila grimshawi]|uniref:RING-type E3 ubiquitin transferase n=1 Tax=Drosophila grimshawi TaxID=7222 RepID=B4JV24_DROGR|nr:E3 ubiquitin-protein ligase RNF123 isoform X2 [Drosophila grimshawi]EDV91344.1 GH14527 [Drosophila grimshawi]